MIQHRTTRPRIPLIERERKIQSGSSSLLKIASEASKGVHFSMELCKRTMPEVAATKKTYASRFSKSWRLPPGGVILTRLA